MEADGDWKLLKTLFTQALAVPPGERSAFLDEHCPPRLRPRLDALLVNHQEAPDSVDNLKNLIFPPPQAAPEQQMKNKHIRHYRVLDQLGQGGMGVVYKALDTRLETIRALKFLAPHLSANEQAKQRFIDEAKRASALDHPNIATIHEIGETDDGQLYIAMTYYEGETLAEKIAEDPLPLDQALDYAAQIARGLATTHAQGIIHRDIKPANIIVTAPTPAEAGGIVKILDFGLAMMADVHSTLTGKRIGTPRYMSPEQARGKEEIDHRTDIWALGAVFYEMLTGEPAFKGDYPAAALYSVVHEDPTPIRTVNPDVPPEVERIVMRCLQKDRAARYASITDLLTDLEGALQEPVPPPSPIRTIIIVGASVLVTLTILLAFSPPMQESVGKILGLSGLPDQMHLVVLSAISTDADPLDQTFTDGLVETVTRQLRQVEDRSLSVVPSRDLENTAVTSPNDAFRMLAVNLAVLVETIREKDTVRIDLGLVDALTGDSLKSTTLTQSVMQPIALNKNLIVTLADLLEIDASALPDLNTGSTFVPGAYEFYTSGMGYLRDYGRYRQIEHVDGAISQFHYALEEDSSYALAHAGLGEAYLRKYTDEGDEQWINLAIQHSQEALEQNSDILQAHITMGLIDTATGRSGSAITAFRYVLARDSAFSDAYVGLARAYEAAGKLDEAEEAFNRAIDTKPDYWGGYNDLGAFLNRQSRYEEAMVQFRHVTKYAPLNPIGYRNLGSMYFFLKDRDATYKAIAFEMYDEALRVKPDDYTTLHNLASMYYAEGLYGEAADAFISALGLRDTDFKVWGSLGSAYTWSGQHNKARDAYQQAIIRAAKQQAVNPRNPETLTFLAEYHVKVGDHERADSLLTQAGSFNPTENDLLFRIGEVYEFLDQRDRALEWIAKALQNGYSISSQLRHPRLKDLFADERFQRLQKQYQHHGH